MTVLDCAPEVRLGNCAYRTIRPEIDIAKAWIPRVAYDDRPSPRSDGHDDIVPLFCPTRQIEFAEYEI